MEYLLKTIGMLMLVGGCSSVSQNQTDVVDNFTVIPCETPQFVDGDPVHHAELAIDIAEYVLAEKGFDCSGYTARVSFCEGVYTVVFFSVRDQSERKYTVDIDADTSRILSVKLT